MVSGGCRVFQGWQHWWSLLTQTDFVLAGSTCGKVFMLSVCCRVHPSFTWNDQLHPADCTVTPDDEVRCPVRDGHILREAVLHIWQIYCHTIPKVNVGCDKGVQWGQDVMPPVVVPFLQGSETADVELMLKGLSLWTQPADWWQLLSSQVEICIMGQCICDLVEGKV